jgi:deoxyribodipyrimidine photo-lyase
MWPINCRSSGRLTAIFYSDASYTRTMTSAQITIYLFNRDLRTHDNELLGRAAKESAIVYPIFIFTAGQVDENRYANPRAVSFMCASLAELAAEIPLCFYHGDTIATLDRLITALSATAIYNNIDVTPYAVRRSEDIAKLCRRRGLTFVQGRDIFLGRHCNLTKADATPYLKFTPFYNAAMPHIRKEAVAPRPATTRLRLASRARGLELLTRYVGRLPDGSSAPGRAAAKHALAKFARSPTNYVATRDVPATASTSRLSAYLHYGILGPNEVIAAIRPPNRAPILRQLLWREFYLYIVHLHHTTYAKASLTIPANNRIVWAKGDARSPAFRRWASGMTGCPIVDAGMRELNATGYMHNRARMIVAMYLIYYLRLDWRLGEMYFARNLIDYDYCNNIGGWMWCAGWEVYSNDWFRPFSMASQMKRFDPEAAYIKRWVPELVDAPVADIVARMVDDAGGAAADTLPASYPPPLIADLGAARVAGIEMYKKAHASRATRPKK